MPHATPSPKPTSPSTPTFPSARLINANYANPNPVPLRCSIILERGEGGRDTRADSQLIIVIDISSPPFLHGSTFDRLKWPQRERGGRMRALISDDFSEEEGGRDKPRRINRAISHDSSSSPILFRFSDPSNYIARSYREGTLWNLNLC